MRSLFSAFAASFVCCAVVFSASTAILVNIFSHFLLPPSCSFEKIIKVGGCSQARAAHLDGR